MVSGFFFSWYRGFLGSGLSRFISFISGNPYFPVLSITLIFLCVLHALCAYQALYRFKVVKFTPSYEVGMTSSLNYSVHSFYRQKCTPDPSCPGGHQILRYGHAHIGSVCSSFTTLRSYIHASMPLCSS